MMEEKSWVYPPPPPPRDEPLSRSTTYRNVLLKLDDGIVGKLVLSPKGIAFYSTVRTSLDDPGMKLKIAWKNLAKHRISKDHNPRPVVRMFHKKDKDKRYDFVLETRQELVQLKQDLQTRKKVFEKEEQAKNHKAFAKEVQSTSKPKQRQSLTLTADGPMADDSFTSHASAQSQSGAAGNGAAAYIDSIRRQDLKNLRQRPDFDSSMQLSDVFEDLSSSNNDNQLDTASKDSNNSEKDHTRRRRSTSDNPPMTTPKRRTSHGSAGLPPGRRSSATIATNSSHHRRRSSAQPLEERGSFSRGQPPPTIPNTDDPLNASFGSLEIFQDETPDSTRRLQRQPPPPLLTETIYASDNPLQALLQASSSLEHDSNNDSNSRRDSELFATYNISSRVLVDKRDASNKTVTTSNDSEERPFLEPSPTSATQQQLSMQNTKQSMRRVCRSVVSKLNCFKKAHHKILQHHHHHHKKPELDILGVSVYHLQNVFLDLCIQYSATTTTNNNTANGGRSFKIYDIENLKGPPGVIRQQGEWTTCPIDGELGAAYVHCLQGKDHVGEATHMLSYSWGYTIGDIVDTLVDFCHSSGLDPKRTYIWICCLCVNQHRVVEEAELKQEQQQTGTTTTNTVAKPQVDFFALFGERVKRIGHLLAMMAPWKAPVYLTRIWCIYELFTAHTNGCAVDIIMPPKEKDSLEQDLLHNGGGIDMLYDTLGNTKVQNARASVEQDRLTILDMIEHSVGYHVLNSQVNDLLRSWVKQVIRQLVVTQKDTNDEGYADFCNKIGSILCENGEHNAALDLHHKALTICVSVLGNEHQQAAISHFGIGDALCVKGDYDGALEELKVGLKLSEALLGDKHPDIAKFLDRIGAVLYYMGDYDGALEMYPRCLTIQEFALGRNHPDTATSYYNIGWVLEAMGYSQGALDFYRKSCSIRESTLGRNHPDTASSYKSVGSALQAQGDFMGALSYYEKCLGIQESVLGRDHPGTASTYNRIGGVKEAEGDYDGALEQYQKCRAIREAVLGRNHPDTTTIYYKIGQVLRESRVRSSGRPQ